LFVFEFKALPVASRIIYSVACGVKKVGKHWTRATALAQPKK